VAVLSDMVTRDSVLIGVPAPAVQAAMVASEKRLSNLTALPAARWPTRVIRFVGPVPSLDEFGQVAVTTKSRMICPMCGGKGYLPRDDGVSGAGERRPIQRGRYLPACPACYGSGLVVEAGLMKMLGTLAEGAARIVWAPETDARSRTVVRQVLVEVLRRLATAPVRVRNLFATYAGRSVAAGRWPRGLVVYAQVRERAEGPDGAYLMLEPWQSTTTVALRLQDLVPGQASGTGAAPPVGSWVILAGMAVSNFKGDLREGIYVLPVVVIPAPVGW